MPGGELYTLSVRWWIEENTRLEFSQTLSYLPWRPGNNGHQNRKYDRRFLQRFWRRFGRLQRSDETIASLDASNVFTTSPKTRRRLRWFVSVGFQQQTVQTKLQEPDDGCLHRRCRHQTQTGSNARSPRHRRNRFGCDVCQRCNLLRR